MALALAVQSLRLVLQRGSSVSSTTHGQVLGETDVANPANLFITYTVQSGDTVFSIAQSHGNISWSAIATLNNLTPPFKLLPGQVLKIPKP